MLTRTRYLITEQKNVSKEKTSLSFLFLYPTIKTYVNYIMLRFYVALFVSRPSTAAWNTHTRAGENKSTIERKGEKARSRRAGGSHARSSRAAVYAHNMQQLSVSRSCSLPAIQITLVTPFQLYANALRIESCTASVFPFMPRGYT